MPCRTLHIGRFEVESEDPRYRPYCVRYLYSGKEGEELNPWLKEALEDGWRGKAQSPRRRKEDVNVEGPGRLPAPGGR